MSDVRIERVEPCGEHGDGCYAGVQRKVLDGFPPEAVEAAVLAYTKAEGFISPLDDAFSSMKAALAAAWDALLRSDSEQTLRISWKALYGEDS